MAVNALIDTGGILALLDRSDRWHNACVAALEQLRLPLMTFVAVLTELFHLVGDNNREVRAAWKFVRSGALTLSSMADADPPSLNALMDKYRHRPMDLADATLVHFAERHSVNLILTIDHNDFETYRIRGNRRFRIVPARDSAGT
jgi:predicted nucleic acid-binding protein